MTLPGRYLVRKRKTAMNKLTCTLEFNSRQQISESPLNSAGTPILFRHATCRTLGTLSSLYCRCNCEAVLNGERYSFDNYVKNAERVR
jgi:hypothetical protein